MRISSLLILVGVGSYLCYKLLFGRRQASSVSLTRASSQLLLTSALPEETKPLEDWQHKISNWSSTPAERKQSIGSEASVHDEDLSLFRSSVCSTSGSIFGDQTVAKLDVLLNEIQDIKKSVGEMDAELLTTRKKRRLARLTTVDVGDCSDANETSPPSPTLEWDSNDINDVTLYSEDQLASVEEGEAEDAVLPTTLANRSDCDGAEARLRLQLPLDQATGRQSPPSPASSSGKGSLASSPDDNSSKEKRLRQMLREAERLGLVDDLRQALLQMTKRDSAFYEN